MLTSPTSATPTRGSSAVAATSATTSLRHSLQISLLLALFMGMLLHVQFSKTVRTGSHLNTLHQRFDLPVIHSSSATNLHELSDSDDDPTQAGHTQKQISRLRPPPAPPVRSSITSMHKSPPNVKADNRTTDFPFSQSLFAYAFVIGGCDPEKPPTYQNYLFNIAISTKILREVNSTADVVALFQMAQDVPAGATLPLRDLQLLHALGVYVYYIPQQTTGRQSFYRTQLDKFRILGLTQYERILFMDGDVMPLGNLDLLFELSVNGTLQENVVMRGLYEPANGGFFLIKPGTLEDIQRVIAWREETALQLPYPHFDADLGWGHLLTTPWLAQKEQGTNWTFLAAFADQGLLYYYTMYHQKSVSFLLRDGTAENWQYTPEGTVELRSQVSLLNFSVTEISAIPGRHHNYKFPLNSFIHFTGVAKPWMRGGPPNDCCTEETKYKDAKYYWFWELSKMNVALDLGIDFKLHWKEGTHRPPLGLHPVYAHAVNASSNLLTPLERVYPENVSEFNTFH